MSELEEVVVSGAEEVAKEAPAEAVPSMEDMKEDLEKSFRKIKVGDMLTGKVIDVNETGVMVDFDYYAPGRIAADEMSADPSFNILTDVAVGDEITAKVVRLDDGAGNLLLSRKAADIVLAWDKLKEMMEQKTVITGTIKEVNKAGAILYVEGIRGFIPASKLAFRFVENTEEYLNKEVSAQIITCEKEGRKLVLSVRDVLFQQRAKAAEDRKKRMNAVQVGTIVEGTVEDIKDYGAFVNIAEGVTGLLHVSQISDKRIKTPEAVLSKGQTVKVKVIKVQDGRISLTMKNLEAPVEKAEPEEHFDYKETGRATTGLADLLKGIKLN